MSLIDELNRDLKQNPPGQPVTREQFDRWLEAFFQPPKDADKMTYEDEGDGGRIFVFNPDGSVHAIYGPESARAVRKYLAERVGRE